MCGWECSGRWRACCRVLRDAWRALRRFVIEGHLIGWMVFIFTSAPISTAPFSFSLPSGAPTDPEALKRIVLKPT